MLLLRRHLAPLLRAAPLLPSPIHHRACTLFSTSASASPTAAPISLEDYLVAACGLAPAEAGRIAKKSFNGTSRDNRKASMEISHCRLNSAPNRDCRLNSAPNRDAILSLLSGVGLSNADIAAVVAADPLILRPKPENIGPSLFAPSRSERIFYNSTSSYIYYSSHSTLPRSRTPSSHIYYSSHDRQRREQNSVIELNTALFRHYGVTLNPELLKDCLLRAEKLGAPRTSQMMRYVVSLISGNSNEKVAAKLDFLKRILGCSEAERYFRYV